MHDRLPGESRKQVNFVQWFRVLLVCRLGQPCVPGPCWHAHHVTPRAVVLEMGEIWRQVVNCGLFADSDNLSEPVWDNMA